jgi:hypothetical protein
MTEEDHAQDLEDLTAEIKRRDEALRIAGMNIVALNEERAKLYPALNTACVLIDQLLADMLAAGVSPSIALRAAKSSFDETIKELLGAEIYSKIKIQLPTTKLD